MYVLFNLHFIVLSNYLEYFSCEYPIFNKCCIGMDSLGNYPECRKCSKLYILNQKYYINRNLKQCCSIPRKNAINLVHSCYDDVTNRNISIRKG